MEPEIKKYTQVQFETVQDHGLQLAVALQAVIEIIGNGLSDQERRAAIRYVFERHIEKE